MEIGSGGLIGWGVRCHGLKFLPTIAGKTVETTESNVHLGDIRTFFCVLFLILSLCQCRFVRECFVAKYIFQKPNGNMEKGGWRGGGVVLGRDVVFAWQFLESCFDMSLSRQVLSAMVGLMGKSLRTFNRASYYKRRYIFFRRQIRRWLKRIVGVGEASLDSFDSVHVWRQESISSFCDGTQEAACSLYCGQSWWRQG